MSLFQIGSSLNSINLKEVKMACIGDTCFIVRQEARNLKLGQRTFVGNECTGDKSRKLLLQAINKITASATKTIDTCPNGCKCEPVKSAAPSETEWTEVTVAKFTLTDGGCRLDVGSSTIETRIVKTPGLCKEAQITVASAAFISEGVEISATDASRLSIENIRKVSKILG
jgi:hypothetical protein